MHIKNEREDDGLSHVMVLKYEENYAYYEEESGSCLKIGEIDSEKQASGVVF